MTAPPGDAATAAPLAPEMKAPDAATRVLEGGNVVVTGLAVEDELPAAVVDVAAAAEDVVVD